MSKNKKIAHVFSFGALVKAQINSMAQASKFATDVMFSKVLGNLDENGNSKVIYVGCDESTRDVDGSIIYQYSPLSMTALLNTNPLPISTAKISGEVEIVGLSEIPSVARDNGNLGARETHDLQQIMVRAINGNNPSADSMHKYEITLDVRAENDTLAEMKLEAGRKYKNTKVWIRNYGKDNQEILTEQEFQSQLEARNTQSAGEAS